MAMKRRKENAPIRKGEWVEYYKALSQKTGVFERFRGSCSRELSYDALGEDTLKEKEKEKKPDTWMPIQAYFELKGIESSKDSLHNKHPWAVPERKEWNEITGLQIIDLTKLNLKYDKSLLTPHHLISCCVTSSINRHWQKIIENEIGYNVNSAHNLVILTNSADVACHLNIPLHEGNHIEGRIQDYISVDEYNQYAESKGRSRHGDDIKFWEDGNSLNEITVPSDKAKLLDFLSENMILKAYHSKVFKYVAPVLEKHFKNCPSDLNHYKFINDMNKTSKKILKQLGDFKWVLSPTGEDYKPNQKKGCCGVKVITSYAPGEGKHLHNPSEGEKAKIKNNALKSCPYERNHAYLESLFINKKAKNRRDEGLLVSTKIKYK